MLILFCNPTARRRSPAPPCTHTADGRGRWVDPLGWTAKESLPRTSPGRCLSRSRMPFVPAPSGSSDQWTPDTRNAAFFRVFRCRSFCHQLVEDCHAFHCIAAAVPAGCLQVAVSASQRAVNSPIDAAVVAARGGLELPLWIENRRPSHF